MLTIRVDKGKNVKVVFVQERLGNVVARLVALDELLCYVFNGTILVRLVLYRVKPCLRCADPFTSVHSTVEKHCRLSWSALSP